MIDVDKAIGNLLNQLQIKAIEEGDSITLDSDRERCKKDIKALLRQQAEEIFSQLQVRFITLDDGDKDEWLYKDDFEELRKKYIGVEK